MKGSANTKGIWRTGTAVRLAARALASVCVSCSVVCVAQPIARTADPTAVTVSSAEWLQSGSDPTSEAIATPAPEASSLQTLTPAAPSADTQRARVARHPIHRTAGQGIEESARRLSKGLELDAAQQAKLAQLLENQRRQIRRLWTDGPPRADHVGATLAILNHTGDEIRAMLNEEQREKYPAAVPQGSLGPAQADLEKWTRIMQSKPPQDADNAN